MPGRPAGGAGAPLRGGWPVPSSFFGPMPSRSAVEPGAALGPGFALRLGTPSLTDSNSGVDIVAPLVRGSVRLCYGWAPAEPWHATAAREGRVHDCRRMSSPPRGLSHQAVNAHLPT